MKKQIPKQDQPEVTQITIDEAIAAATQNKSTHEPKDPCVDCQNHTCDWGTCHMADKK